jgi:hypothetical protein
MAAPGYASDGQLDEDPEVFRPSKWIPGASQSKPRDDDMEGLHELEWKMR